MNAHGRDSRLESTPPSAYPVTMAARRSGVLLVLCVLWPRNAHAYLDPGTGSYFLQLVLAALLGGLVSLKLAWGRIVSRVSELRDRLSRRR